MNFPKQATDGLGYAAAAMTTAALIPQLARVVKTRSTKDISLGMFSIYTTGVLFWLMYGVLSHAKPVLIANAISLVLALTILILKIRFDHKQA